MKLSLILATVGRSDEFGHMVSSLIEQTDPGFELLVVDQNPDERLAPHVAHARAAGLHVQHLRLAQPSLAGARNLGLSHARGEVIAFPDDDCWYEPGTVAAVRAAFSAAPDLQGVVGCWVEQNASGGKPLVAGDLSLDAWRRFRGGDASSISLFFRRELFDCLGGFDERFGVGQWYGAAEETDFLLRALAARARLMLRPEVRVHHIFGAPGPGTLSALFKATRRRSRGTGAIYAKHHLSAAVILRGMVAPLALPVLRRKGLSEFVRGAGTALGRIEGYLSWHWSRE